MKNGITQIIKGTRRFLSLP